MWGLPHIFHTLAGVCYFHPHKPYSHLGHGTTVTGPTHTHPELDSNKQSVRHGSWVLQSITQKKYKNVVVPIFWHILKPSDQGSTIRMAKKPIFIFVLFKCVFVFVSVCLKEKGKLCLYACLSAGSVILLSSKGLEAAGYDFCCVTWELFNYGTSKALLLIYSNGILSSKACFSFTLSFWVHSLFKRAISRQ